MKAKVKHPYYSFAKLDSYNAAYNFAVGGRGIGKTYGRKLAAIRRALKTPEQFIYLRRYKDELKASIRTFVDDMIANGEFDEWEFRVNGNRLEASGIEFKGEKKREWKILGYFLSLSTAQSQKSVAFPLVTEIIFDEFIIERGAIHYLPDEANVFNNFYSTVDRGQDKTRVYFLANAVSITNPYFLEYDIKADAEIIRRGKLDDGTYFMVCHIIKSEEYAQSLSKTKFGQFISGTDYEAYAVGNVFHDNNEHLLAFKDESARYLYTLRTGKGTFSIWYNGISGNFYAQQKLPREQKIYVTAPELMRSGTYLMQRNDKLLGYLRTAFTKGVLSFDEPKTRNALIEIFKR